MGKTIIVVVTVAGAILIGVTLIQILKNGDAKATATNAGSQTKPLASALAAGSAPAQPASATK
jgi:hypothetical protein